MQSETGEETMRARRTIPVAALLAALAVGACDDDDGTGPATRTTTFEVRIENVFETHDFIDSGVFDTPVGASAPAPLMPGDRYEIEFGARPGDAIHFATMFIQSNDLFYGPDEEGIALFDNGTPITGDVTDQVALWDAGTEINQEPGLGPDQAPNQSGPDTGPADPTPEVRLAPNDFGNLPDVADVVLVEIESLGEGRFMLRITNVSNDLTLMTSDGSSGPVLLAPGVVAVGPDEGALFEPGMAEPGNGLEAVAEDGDPSTLAASLADRTGFTGPFAPGVFIAHQADGALFESGQPASAGLEDLAEDGDPSTLAGEVSGGVFDTPDGASAPGPILPGDAYTFMVEAVPGDRLSFATMMVQSNDLFVAPSADAGIELFPGGTALGGDITGMLDLWDAGTEEDQQPGVGSDQAPRQAGPDTGPAEGGVVRVEDDQWTYPAVSGMVQVTVTPVSN